MKARLGRSTGVEHAIALPSQDAHDAPQSATLAAFEHLYRSSWEDVYAYVAALLRNRSAAEEVTAAAFERAWRRRGQIDRRRGSPRAWLFGIARNAALDELRRSNRTTRIEGELAEEAAPDPGDEAVRRQTVRGALSALDARERELVALKFFAGLDNAEIGKVIGTSESNAGTRLHRTIEKLRRACDEAD